MKFCVALLLAMQLGLCAGRTVDIADHRASVQGKAGRGVIDQIVTLIEELKTGIEADETAEQKSYDKYACWCEKTLKKKAADMDLNEKDIAKLSESIEKASAEVAEHQVEIANLKKGIAANVESQGEAKELRDKERTTFEESKTESESAIKALDAAIKVLAGAGTGTKTGFLGTLQEAQVLGVVAGVKNVMKYPESTQKLSTDDVKVVDEFVEKPEDFFGTRMPGFSAAQIANNPFGDYAPRSGRIQGILSELKQTFETELTAMIKEEADKVTAYEDLMGTKTKELATLQKTLETQEASASSKAAQMASDKQQRDDTQETASTDKDFFTETKKSCKEQANTYSERVRLRTEELHGIDTAIKILSSDEAKATFNGSATTFVQLHAKSSDVRHQKAKSVDDVREKAYAQLKKLATRFNNIAMAQIAAEVTTGGHFDTIIAAIDQMIKTLREEEAEDITHRDLCQMKEAANANEKADLEHDISKADKDMERAQATIDDLQGQIDTLQADIDDTKENLKTLKEKRIQASKDFLKALKDDEDAVELLEKAIASLTQFYIKNKLTLELAQKNVKQGKEDPPPPELSWSGSYGGKASESTGVVSILTMIKDDTIKEAAALKADDAEAEATYLKMKSSLEANLGSQEALKVAKEKAMAAFVQKKADMSEYKDGKDTELNDEKDKTSALTTDCAWVATTFKSRKDKRKLEMEGLEEAKAFLAGVDNGEAELPAGDPTTF